VRHDIRRKPREPQDGVATTIDRGERRQSERPRWRCACLPTSDREAPRLGGNIMNRDLRNVLRSPDQSWDGKVHLSPSELLSLLNSFHARLDAFFEEMRVFPEAAARQKAADSRSLTTEIDLPLVSAQVGVSGSSPTRRETAPADRNAPTRSRSDRGRGGTVESADTILV
jgi:hypothetical protein